ncbi:CehA/McbA family metallohydrolase [Parahaliea aestuarii]|uniref:PHP domain-containing protein n=1 Tax=Parahaliea aestuarii TaxID=1852021 RepID=A0A5C8ZKT8_9GAMM|nr:CehA/McbA family metallohydrolase [Parahaliea aestuarii]TXS89196.1 PHP domain-containing protein [Parahaliea aestuarii]
MNPVVLFRCCLALWLGASLSAKAGEISLSGVIDDSHHTSYVELPFSVPAGTSRINVEFDYPRGQGVTIDLGLLSPTGLRGWSGGNKAHFTLGEVDATPSYLAGAIVPGEWRLLLGVPNAEAGARVAYQARIELLSGAAANTQAFAEAPLKREAGWYRGDLHAHTGHSDGSCVNDAAVKVACPLVETVRAARNNGLDFIAISEHNTRSHFQSQRELQPFLDDLLLLPAQEITTFYGHANLFGSTGFVDFRLADANAQPLLEQLAQSGGILSINHPGLPSNRDCMGCGWTAATDYSAISAMEVVNGGTLRATKGWVHSPVSGIPLWEKQLAAGQRITGIAGSDNHNPHDAPGSPGAVATPTTVVYADELSQRGIIDGLRSGRVFIDVHGSYPQASLELTASAASQSAQMGQVLTVAAGEEVEFRVVVGGMPDAAVKAWYRGQRLQVDGRQRRRGEKLEARYNVESDGQPGWLRVEITSADGQPLLISNPVYLNLP